MKNVVGISIEKMMHMEILKDAKFLAGSEGKNRRISKVNVMEVPDIMDWIGEGELLLTTAYSIKDNIKILADMIPNMEKKGVAGIALKTKRYIDSLPEEIIKIANELNFPVIEIPYNISHTEIITAVLTEVIEDQMKLILKIDEFNREIMDIMMKGGSLREIAYKLYGNIGNTIAIYENIYNTCEIVCEEEYSSTITDIVRDEYNKYFIGKTSIDKKSSHIKTKSKVGDKTVEGLIIPITMEEINYGGIFIFMDKKELSPIDIMLIESYIHIIALDFVRKLSNKKIESNYRVEFFNDLLSMDENRRERALHRANVFNFDGSLRYLVIVILVKGMGDLKNVTSKSINSARQLISKVLSIVEQQSKWLNGRVLFIDKSDRIIILYGKEVEILKEEIKNDANTLCRNVFKEASKKNIEKQISIGIGRSYGNIDMLWKSYKQAKWIVKNFENSNVNEPINYDDMGVYRILCCEEVQPELKQFYEESLESLVKYDMENESELVNTLRIYFDCNGNVKKMSEKMFTHYNTIIYRLQRIRDIIGNDLDNPDDKLKLQLALKYLDLIQKSK